MATIASLMPCALGHLERYTDPGSLFAFGTYDSWWARSPDVVTPSEVFMANCLSLRLSGFDVAPLFGPGQTAATRLRRAMQDVLDAIPAERGPRFEDLTSIDDVRFQLFRSACAATDAAGDEPKVAGWTAVTVSKVLHRLRPHLVPVVDSEVSAFYGVGKNRPALYAALHADLVENREWLGRLADGRSTPDGRELSLLRTADILVWHHRTTGCTGAADG
jgi:hypothetical protein